MPHRKTPLAIDHEVYKWRHLVENFFCKLKEFKRIAMRSDKTDQSFAAMIHLTATVIGSNDGISTGPILVTEIMTCWWVADRRGPACPAPFRL